MLDKLLKTSEEDFSLRLYTAISPGLDENTVIGHLTAATFTGYSPIALTRSGWPAASTSAGTTSSAYAQQTWTHGGGGAQTILGYYVVGATSGTLLWVEAFAQSRTLNPGDELRVTPRMELG